MQAFISRLGEGISGVFRRIVPDPFVIAVVLTVVTLALAVVFTESSVVDVVDYWAGRRAGPGGSGSNAGVWGLLSFSMQMCMILVTGHALAMSPPVVRGLRAMSGLPRTSAQAVLLVAGVACVLGVLNWGLGLIAGAVLARRVGEDLSRRGVRAHYPLLAAAGYTGLLVWHGGFSGSAPLKMTTERGVADVFHGSFRPEPIPLTEMLFSPMNLFITGGLVVMVPVLMSMLTPGRAEAIQPIEAFVVSREEPRAPSSERLPPVVRVLERTPIVNFVLVALIGAWAWRYYVPPEAGAASGITALTPDTVNLTMLMLGLALHGTPASYLRAVEESASGCAGILLQFPLYAGIMAVMLETGLTADLARVMAEWSTRGTMPLLTLLDAAVINLFVPSGGGQWAIQGPIAMEAGAAAGVEPARMVMVVAYGDELTNMLQPFWALPLLAITGVKAREIVGYTAVVMVAAGVWMAIGVTVVPVAW